jgi:N-acyl amino acid synthase of PEP-CTERM/exosortase system
MAGVSHWQEFLSCYRQHFEVVRADTPSLLDDAYRLRYQVYCVENRYEDPGQQANGRERDVYDDRSVHSLLIHRRSGVAAGTMRVILPGTVTQDLPLPINTVTDSGLQQLLRQLPPSHTAEISRFAVSKVLQISSIFVLNEPRYVAEGESGASPNVVPRRFSAHSSLWISRN